MSLQRAAILELPRASRGDDAKWLHIIASGGATKRRGAAHGSPHESREEALPSGRCQPGPCGRIGTRPIPSDGNDEMLLRRVAKGDRSAMRIIFLRHQQRVFRFILRIVRNHDLAQDVVSQVFLDVWRIAWRFEYRSRVSTWLLSIARFKAINAMRRPTYQALDESDLSEAVDPIDTPEVSLSRKETSRILRAGVEQLSPVHRQIIYLFYYHDCSVAEVSERIGVPRATVKSRLFYARKHLASVLVAAGFPADPLQPDIGL